MSITEVFQTAGAILAALGGGAVIVAGFSAWLGRMWADRLMEKERAKHASALEELRSQLTHASNAELNRIKNELDIYREKHLKGHHDKIQTYRLVVDIVSELLGDLDSHDGKGEFSLHQAKRLDEFNRSRLKAYGYLAMMAPQSVMDAFNQLIDYLFSVVHAEAPYDWAIVRSHANKMLNEVRKDAEIDESPIAYHGTR